MVQVGVGISFGRPPSERQNLEFLKAVKLQPKDF
jgi:hypothetical protein